MSTQPTFEDAYQLAIDVARSRSADLEGPSIMQRLVRLPRAARESIWAKLTVSERGFLRYAWPVWARPKQRPDLSKVPHRTVLWMGGRGEGKTRTGSERVRERVEGGARRIAIVGPTMGDIEKYMLGVEEEDEGLLNVFPPGKKPRYLAKPTYMVKFHTGAIGYVVSAETPEFRGPNLDTVWADEICKWRFLVAIWSNIELATRALSSMPIEILVTTTPRPIRALKEIIADPDTVTLVGRQEENAVNLDEHFVRSMGRKYGGTRLGQQELDGELLGDSPGALFRATGLDEDRVDAAPWGLRTVISVDCAISEERRNDPTGIVAVGIDESDHLYVLEDKTGRYSAETWAGIVVDQYDELGAVAIVYEKNRGGNLIEPVIRAAMKNKRGEAAARALVFQAVHATRGKWTRAEPVGAIHEQHRLHIVGRGLRELEDEITTWDPEMGGKSPNRLDALVWGVWFLAKLGDGVKDYRATMHGLEAATAAIRMGGQASSSAAAPTNPLGALLPSWGAGGRKRSL